MLDRWIPISCYFCCLILALACGGSPPSFRQIELDQAQKLIRSERWLNVVEVQEGERRRAPLGGSSVVWTLRADEPPTIPALSEAPVLVVASEPAPGYRAAALIASERNHKVYLVITMSPGERGTLYARDPAEAGDSVDKETSSGRDS